MGQFVIAAYRPRSGKKVQLLQIIREHMPILRSQGLVTDRPAYAMRASDGTIVEVFEWKSAKAAEEAHSNQVVRALWARFDEVCECESLANLPECQRLFSPFQPID